jgi:hypothetical protein
MSSIFASWSMIHQHTHLRIGWLIVLLSFSASIVLNPTVYAQTASSIEIIEGTLNSSNDPVQIDITGVQAGDVIYATLEATSGGLDTYLILADAAGNILAESDDIYFENTNSALVYRVQESGNLILAVSRYDDTTEGDYILRYSINNPDVFPVGERRVVQEETGTVVSDDEYVFYDLYDLRAGDTVYVYVEATDANLDSYVFFGNFEFDTIYAENDDIAIGITNSALFYTVSEDGDYSIAVTAYDADTTGDFRILIGVNAPQVLSGDAIEQGDTTIATAGTADEVAEVVQPRVQQFRGQINADQPRVYYDLFDMQAGDILYVYAEGLTGGLDTYIGVGNLEFTEVFLENDDIDYNAGNLNSAFEYTIPEDGDYSLLITSAVDGGEGTYRLLLGFNAPNILDGSAPPTDDLIAQLYTGEATSGSLAVTNCSTLGERPVLSGTMQTFSNDRFVIHYTLEGADATSESLVQQMADVMNEVWDYQIVQLGWMAPPSDCGEGGDTRFDVYVMELENQGILGYAQPEGLVGDNPASTEVEQYAAYSYLALDNNYDSSADPIALMRATAAHEFHHGVQFGFDLNDGDGWYYEATATWMETQTFPQEQDATGYVSSLFATPGLCLGNINNDESGVRIYGEWTMIDSMARDYGMDAVAKLWRNIADTEYMQPFYDLLSTYGTDAPTAVINYATRNLLLDYELSDLFYSTVAIAGRVNGEGRVISRGTGVQELGVNYLRVVTKGTYTFSVVEPNLALYYVGINGDQAQRFALGQSGSVDTSAFSEGYLIILNTTQHSTGEDCTATRWTLDVKPASVPPANAESTWSAERFTTPTG